MKHLGLVFLTYACCVLQTDFRHACAVGPVEPNFPMLALMIVALTVEGGPAVIWAALIGLLSDALTPGRLGIDMLGSVLAVLIALRWTARRCSASVLGQAGLGTVTVFMVLMLSTSLRSLLAEEPMQPGLLMLTSLATAAYTALLGVVLLFSLRLLKQLRPTRPINESLRISNQWNRLTTEP